MSGDDLEIVRRNLRALASTIVQIRSHRAERKTVLVLADEAVEQLRDALSRLEAQPAPPVECPARRVLKKLSQVLPAINSKFWDIYYGEFENALSSPCSPCPECAELSERLGRAEAYIREDDRKDSQELTAAIAERDALRQKVERLTEALRPFAAITIPSIDDWARAAEALTKDQKGKESR